MAGPLHLSWPGLASAAIISISCFGFVLHLAASAEPSLAIEIETPFLYLWFIDSLLL